MEKCYGLESETIIIRLVMGDSFAIVALLMLCILLQMLVSLSIKASENDALSIAFKQSILSK